MEELGPYEIQFLFVIPAVRYLFSKLYSSSKCANYFVVDLFIQWQNLYKGM